MSKECPSCHRECEEVFRCVDCDHEFCRHCGSNVLFLEMVTDPSCPKCSSVFRGRGEKISRDDDDDDSEDSVEDDDEGSDSFDDNTTPSVDEESSWGDRSESYSPEPYVPSGQCDSSAGNKSKKSMGIVGVIFVVGVSALLLSILDPKKGNRGEK